MPDVALELMYLQKRIESCEDCFKPTEKLHSACGTGRLNPLIMLINHHPFFEDIDKDRERIIGKNSSAYDSMLHAIGVTWEQVWCTSCVKCIGRRGLGVPKICKKQLDIEIQIVNPKLIICLGEVPFRALTNDDNALIDWTPNKEYNIIKGKKVIAMVSPETISQNPRYERYWTNAAKCVKQHISQPTLEWWCDGGNNRP